MHLTAFVERGYASSVRMSRGIQIPEYVLQGCLAAYRPVETAGDFGKFNSLIEAGPVNLVKTRRRKHYEVT
jgi:hypothetical protein